MPVKRTDFQILQSAIHLPSHEEALQALREAPDVNARYLGKHGNILHDFIVNFKPDKLRVVDFKALLELGVDVDAKDNQGQAPLHCTAQFPSFELAELLVAHGANIHAVDDIGNSVLWRAVMDYRGEVDMLKLIRLLLAHGASLDEANKYGSSARGIIERRRADPRGGSKEWDLSGHLSEYL